MKNTLAIHGGEPVRNAIIYYGRQYIDETDIKAVSETLMGDYLTTGPCVTNLEKKLCQLTGAKYAVCVSNGTAALHAACYASQLGCGDEVITSPITFAASANCVLYVGATPVFADIDPSTYNISPQSIIGKITDRTKAIIAVDYAGQAAELNEIKEICNAYNLIFIEDAAHSIGTRYCGHNVGSIADMTTFSFHPVKTVTGGEGGAVLTNDKELYNRLMLFRTHGITRDIEQMQYLPDGPWYYEQIILGYNYRITDFQAALIMSQLDKLPLFSKRRKEIVTQYNEAFSKMPELILQRNIPESDTVNHLYVLQLRLDKLQATRLDIFNALYAENVCCNVHYIPVYTLPYYKKLGYSRGICPLAEALYENIISIPLYYGLSDNDVESVINAVQKVIDYYR